MAIRSLSMLLPTAVGRRAVLRGALASGLVALAAPVLPARAAGNVQLPVLGAVPAAIQPGSSVAVLVVLGADLPPGTPTVTSSPLTALWVLRAAPRLIAIGLAAPPATPLGPVPISISAGGQSASVTISVVVAAALVQGFGSPDDAAVGPDGTIFFTDFGNQGVNAISPDGRRLTLGTGVVEPEGVAVERGGTLIVADQQHNAALRLDVASGTFSLVAAIPNLSGAAGVDGLAVEASSGDILFPDSPNGRLLRISPDGSVVTQLPGRFVRPTGMALDAAGNYIVADEFGGHVFRVTQAGQVASIGGAFNLPDDVVIDQGRNIIVNSLGDGTIKSIPPDGGPAMTLLSGLSTPHGVAVDHAGNLVVVDSGTNRLLRLVRTFAVTYPPTGPVAATPGATIGIPLLLRRATAFAGAVAWSVPAMPAGVTASIATDVAFPGLAVLVVRASAPVAGAVVVRAQSGGLFSEVQVVLTPPAAAGRAARSGNVG